MVRKILKILVLIAVLAVVVWGIDQLIHPEMVTSARRAFIR